MKRKTIAIWLMIMGPMLLFSYNNCAPRHSFSGDSSAFSSGSSCDEARLQSFERIVYPFVAQQSTCAQCHVEGGVGLGTFAAKDSTLAFQAFLATGLTKVSFNAVNPDHKPPMTGVQNKTAVDSINVLWPKAEDEYLDCLSKTGSGGLAESLLTSDKPAPNSYNITNVTDPTQAPTSTLEWDLEMGSDLDPNATRSAPAKVRIDVKPHFYTENNRIKNTDGYVFSNPRIIMKNGTDKLVVEGLYIYLTARAFWLPHRIAQ